VLTQINIRHFAIVDALELDLTSGMTVLTGETGAGKSILVDALALLLGRRADAAVVRDGCERCELSADFVLAADSPLHEWLAARELDAGGTCQIRRVIRKDGRSRAYLNGSAVTMGTLSEAGMMLVEIHGQHEHQGLLFEPRQRDLLDGFGAYPELTDAIARSWKNWTRAQSELRDLEQTTAPNPEHEQLLQYQLAELDSLDLGDNELESLEAEHQCLSHAQDLTRLAADGLRQLDGDSDAATRPQIGRMLKSIQEHTHIDPRLENIAQTLEQAGAILDEASSALTHFANGIEDDPQRLAQLETRLGNIYDLARKHRVQAAELPARHRQLRAELERFSADQDRLDALAAELRVLHERYEKDAQKLSVARRSAARRLSAQTTRLIASLGMEDARFEVTTCTAEAGSHGGDVVRFMVSLNTGQKLRALKRVASGGELSRISLAIQVATLQVSGKPTLVFDEVDSGIGGATADIVGRLLRKLGNSAQVLCVTHLPQVAAQATHHVQVSKAVQGNATHTSIQVLNGKDRIDELARMLGGVRITDQTRAHAEEMLGMSAHG